MRGWSSAAAAVAEAARFRLDCGGASPSASPSSSKSPRRPAALLQQESTIKITKTCCIKKEHSTELEQPRGAADGGEAYRPAKWGERLAHCGGVSDLAARLGGANPSKRF
jgi:hypothetical protein